MENERSIELNLNEELQKGLNIDTKMDTDTNFRISAKTLFLTYPTTTLTPEEVLKQLKVKLPDLESYVIGHSRRSKNWDSY
jgi:hypothetical protein